KILEKIKKDFEIPVLTDIHSEMQAPLAGEVVDVIQIPAFLSRQTVLLEAAGRTGKIVNIKKAQFMAAEDMKLAAEKVSEVGNSKILLTERGTFFGYRNLVVDMRNLVTMGQSKYPVIFDATHSVQLPSASDGKSGGQPQFISPLAQAAMATGHLSGLFLEVHPEPEKALSDASSMLDLPSFRNLLKRSLDIFEIVKKWKENNND
ncbi:MAG: 3-deoxy-8-phosphooctulonate synthase, partial [Calditrichia bacterium]|nr:3-deoxy-8-phosphooctulonate synthase [Calditrichia bacterium]